MRRLAVLLAASLLVLAACGEDTGDDAGSDTPPETTVEGDKGSATVEGDYGEEPEVEVDGPFEVDETDVEVMVEGDGETVKKSDTIQVDYHGVNGRSGEVFDSSFEAGKPAEFPLDGVVAGFSKGLVDQKIGSRVVISVTSQDGYPEGNPAGGIEPGDSLLFVVDLKDQAS